jgi:folate-binding protein YgfZ
MPPVRLDRSLIRVSGPDATSFLQGLLTQDIAKLAATPVLYAGLLTPQGKVIADMFTWAAGADIVLDLAPERGEDVLRRLGLYKLRAKVELGDVSGEHAVLVGEETFAGAHRDPRLDGLGWRALAPAAYEAARDSGAYRARCITLGVPDLAHDAAPDEVFALEALFEELHGVDFQKGCFVGQENVSRMKRRATTRKKFCPLVFDGAAPALGVPVTAGEAELGSVRAVAGARALALIRLDRALEAARRGLPLSAGGAPARLDPPAWLILPAPD